MLEAAPIACIPSVTAISVLFVATANQNNMDNTADGAAISTRRQTMTDMVMTGIGCALLALLVISVVAVEIWRWKR